MKKAMKKKETEVDFEEKKMNLSLDEKENNKENERRSVGSPERDPYYDGLVCCQELLYIEITSEVAKFKS